MRKPWIASCIAAGVLAAIGMRAAHADENSGLYLGVGLGDFSNEIESVDDVDIDFDSDDDASRIFAGWRFNRFFAVQLDYLDLGESNEAINLLNVQADTTAITPSFVATLPLGPIELFAKAGIAFYDLEISFDDQAVFDDSGEDTVYGAGIGLTLIDRLSLRLEYEKYDISEFADSEAVWVTAHWRF